MKQWPLRGLCEDFVLKCHRHAVRTSKLTWLTAPSGGCSANCTPPFTVTSIAAVWFTVSLLLTACVCVHLGCLAFHWAEAWCNKAQNRFISIRDGWLGNEWWKKKGPSKCSLNRGVNQKQRADNITVMGFWGFCLYMFPQIQSPVRIQALKQAHKMCCFCVSRSYREQSEAQISWVISSCSIICPRHPAEWMRVCGYRRWH